MPDLSIPSPAGMVLTPDLVLSGQNGSNSWLGYVHRPVPGQLLQTHGTGEFLVPHIGIRGSLTAEVLAGAPGKPRAIIKLTTALTSPPRDTIQLSLDSLNRPVLTIAYEGASIITASEADGPEQPEGTEVRFRVVWDSVYPLASGNHVDFTFLDGTPVPGNMGAIPTVPWTTIVMRYVRVGFGTNLEEFNGTILNLQVGDQRM